MSEQDERELFRRLDEDADRATLVTPEALRGHADRRTAVRAATGTVAVVLAVAGVALAANGMDRGAGPEIIDAPTPTMTVSKSPTKPDPSMSATPDAANIPGAAWLGKADLGFRLSGTDDLAVSAPCGRSPFDQDLVQGSVVTGGTRQGVYHAPGTPEEYTPDGSVTQSIALMRDAQAATELWYLMQETVKDCPEETREEPGAIRYSLVDGALPASSVRPDRHLLVKVSTSFEYLFGSPPDAGPDRIDSYISVLQVGDAVTFLEVRGWEASPTPVEEAQLLAVQATRRLLDWRAD